jgi:preprotein translocase subunit SecF
MELLRDTNFDSLGKKWPTGTLQGKIDLRPFAIHLSKLVVRTVGARLRTHAIPATFYALGGMLLYLTNRFEWVYGVPTVLAMFHDTVITTGLFSIFDKEISLTVIAALLTLVGYSMNDMNVAFGLSRTTMASSLAFLTATALLLFGGQGLNGFSFVLLAGIIVGTYSSIFATGPRAGVRAGRIEMKAPRWELLKAAK